jgi:hypothetical protein
MYMDNSFTHNAPCCFIIWKLHVLSNPNKILHNKLNKWCSLFTPHNAVQGTGCNLAWGETVFWEWRCNTEFKRDFYRAVQKVEWYLRHAVNSTNEWY